MEQTKPPSSRLLNTSCIENKDDLEEKFERCHTVLQNLTSGLSEKEAHDTLNNAVCKDKTHEEVSLGLLVVILTEPQEAAKSYRDLTLITRDGLAIVLGHLNQLVLERYLRLNDVARGQLLWLLREMIRTSVANVDNLCLSLLRHAAGGDTTPRNLFLVDALLDIFQENRPWLDKNPLLVASIVYSYLRLIEDHSAPHLAALRQKEITFLVTLIRERMVDCLVIGRDLVRLLQNVARIQEFESLWKDLLLNPKSLCPSFTSVLQLLQTRTSRRFLQSRLTPDMERKLVFLTSQVRFGNHKRYQDWFQRQYLATPESQSLRCDLIRFIVGVIHPTNELLCSDIIPRWAVIGWLLTTCTSTVAASNAKLALFYDWLFFEPEKDNIMNIEPAILVMHNSMRSHPAVTATLLDFLCRIIPNFYPALTDKVRNGIFSSLRQILEKRVLPSLYPLFDSPKLDRELRTKIRETFKEFCLPPNTDPGKMEELNKDLGPGLMLDNSGNSAMENNHVSHGPEPAFSDDEEEMPLRIVTKAEEEEDEEDIPLATVKLKNEQKIAAANCVPKKDEITTQLNLILEPEELKAAVESLHSETDNEVKCQTMERIVQMVIEDEIDGEMISSLATCISTILAPQITDQIFPTENTNDEAFTDSISTPIFVMFRNQFQLCKEEDNRRKLLARVLAEIQAIQPRIGYLLLYFLKVWGREEEKREGEPSKLLNDVKASVYKDFCGQREKKLEACLVSDLKLCHEDSICMLCYLVPDVFTGFQNVTLGNAQLLHLVVSTVDSRQLQDLICEIMQGHLKMLKKESFTALLTASLNWETFEQYCFWQLICAHDFPIEYVLPVLPKLQFRDHAEALTSILFMLKQEKPTMELLRQLLARQSADGDMFVVAALRYWCRDYEDKLSELLANLLSTRYPATSPNKRKRTGAKQNQQSGPPTGEQVLGHLDQLRQHCNTDAELQLYQTEGMQRALQQAQAAGSDSLRKNYGDLFALAEVSEENEPPPPPPTSSSRKHATASSGAATGKGHRKIGASTRERSASKRAPPRDRTTESSDQSSEEEEIVKPKQAKKRKKMNPVDSDSD
ncbi:integrator complex subunit 3 isoform X2 [Venturia canescens]|uniref:integrator complex subunit 3 isoform X2 n=1 Tax=Venturia canescens TaxID=32260 RepID=UPI001C9CA720|nr:integrator complex subunit 3 isoform X2 [Venturia canescens]